jgi:two-component system, NarL family, response regulator DesR
MTYSIRGHQADAAPSGARHTRVMSDQRIRLLVVDDDARVRTAIGQTVAFETDLVLVGEAKGCADALALAIATGPAVALVDVFLPDEETGLKTIRGLGRNPGCAVVAMSVRSTVRSAALAAGAISFIEKGDIEAVLARVRAAARTRQ